MNIYKIFEIASYFIDFYLLLISLRIILSWFASGLNIPGIQYLARVTDPFLNIFRKTHFLRFGFLDFSALLGIFLLIFISTLLKHFSLGQISLAITLAVLVQTIFSGIRAIFSMLSLILLVRIIGLFVRIQAIDALWYRLDGFLQPLLVRFTRWILPRREVPYGSSLAMFLAACLLSGLLLRVSLPPLISLITRIPL